MNGRIRAVFDCMVFLQAAARGENPAAACLLLVELGAIELFLSSEIVAELRDVLERPRIRQRFAVLTDTMVEQFLAALSQRATLMPELPCVFAYERDPKDEPYLNLAIAAAANYLVSRDRDLLDLNTAADPEGERLHRHAPHLRIVEPVEFLAQVRKAESTARPPLELPPR